jgi:hypothetical protein
VSVACSEHGVGTTQSKIINAPNVDTRFPQVGTFHVEAESFDRCSAVVVADNVAITAAHCLSSTTATAAVFNPCKLFERDPRASFQSKIRLNASYPFTGLTGVATVVAT